MTSKHKQQKKNIDKLDFIKITNFRASKDTIKKNEKANHRMRESICRSYI